MRHLATTLLILKLLGSIVPHASNKQEDNSDSLAIFKQAEKILQFGRRHTTKENVRSFASTITQMYLRLPQSTENTFEHHEYIRNAAHELWLKPCGKQTAVELSSVADHLVLLGYIEEAITGYQTAIELSNTSFFIETVTKKLTKLQTETGQQ